MTKSLKLHLIIYILTPIGDLGISLFSPSLPALTSQLHLTSSLVMLTISMYLAGLGIGQLVTGTLSDTYGRKPILLVGLSIFFVMSLLIIFSRKIDVILMFRLFQGFGAGAAASIAKSLVTDNLTGYDLLRVSSTRTIVWGLGPIIAPVMGGYMQYYFGWQSIFYFFAFISFLLVSSLYFILPETNTFRSKLNLDKILANYREILGHTLFVGALLMLSFCYSLIVAFHVLGTFLIQRELGFNAIVFGHIALLNGLGYFLGTVVNRFLIKRFTSDGLITTGLAIMLLGSVSGILLASWWPLSIGLIAVPTIIVMISIGFIFPNCSAKTLSLFPQAAGTASAISGSFYVFFAAIISYFVTLLESKSIMPYFLFFCFIWLISTLVYFRFVRRL